MSIRKKFISATSAISGALALDALVRLSGQNFVLPFYHIVSDEDCPHIKYLYDFKAIKQFESDLDYLTARYQPVGADALPDILTGKYKNKKIMLLTFDDGLRQMYEIVAPILLRRGIPAIFFLNTDFIDNKALMFRYKASLALSLDHDKYYSALDSRSEMELMESTGPELNKVIDDFLVNYQPYMTTDQIKSLITQGFTIGAHSCSHPYYEDLSLDQQLGETLNCMSILQNDFGVKEKLFAFPFTDHGVSKRFFEEIYRDAKIEYSFGGAGIKKDIDPRQIQRIPMEAGTANAEQVIKSEYLYHLLRSVFANKNTIARSG